MATKRPFPPVAEQVTESDQRHTAGVNQSELEMWVDVTIRFPASEDGTGSRFDFFNLKRAVEAMSAAGVDDRMGIEIERTERGLFFVTTG